MNQCNEMWENLTIVAKISQTKLPISVTELFFALFKILVQGCLATEQNVNTVLELIHDQF